MSLSLADISGRPATESACFGTHTLSHSGRSVSNEETPTTSAKHEDCKRNNSHDEGALILQYLAIGPPFSTLRFIPILLWFWPHPGRGGYIEKRCFQSSYNRIERTHERDTQACPATHTHTVGTPSLHQLCLIEFSSFRWHFRKETMPCRRSGTCAIYASLGL